LPDGSSQWRTAPEYRDPPASQRGRAVGAPVVETTTEARQGVTGHNVRYVLFISLAAVIFAFGLIYAVFWG